MRRSVKVLGAGLLILAAATSLIWYADVREDHRGMLVVSFLDVGAGDAVFIQAPSGRQVLVDGGSDDSILRQLGTVMPFYDRSLDAVVATAPLVDKVGGLTNVLSRYTIATIVRSAARSGAPQVQAFDGALTSAEARGTRLLVAQRGQLIDLDSGTYMEIFFPDRDASNMAPSDGCLVMRLVYGRTSFFFSCGPPALESYLATLDGTKLKSDVLLATGRDPELFVGFVSPQFAVVPQSCNIEATSSVFSELGVQTLDTCDGSVTFVSDGQTVSTST